ncbi:MAG: SDR family NAD(P)-dependent oxidoreductase [Bdellovibrionaceae bacterium]|nr:SDR family NAD(P)-dependent oxidoreductase [Pseudobdellovibrionaceae bacterium]
MKIAIIGSSGGIGSALVKELAQTYPLADIFAFSRKAQNFNSPLVKSYTINYQEEESLRQSAHLVGENNTWDLVVVATGLLHDKDIQPERSFKELSVQKFQKLFLVNTITPALIAKHFIPKLNQKKRSVFAVLSARVGSISDNRLGGWYAYRASKTALNMIVKNLAIEVRRKAPLNLIVGLHPGTVDSPLSKPFQKSIAKEKLFTAEESAQKLIKVLKKLQTKDSGKGFAWDGQEIPP